MRGGGGNFGVVTRFTFRLHEVGPNVCTAASSPGRSNAPRKSCDAYRAITEHVTARACRRGSVLLPRSARAIRAAERGTASALCAMCVCYTGDLDGVGRVVAPIRALGKPGLRSALQIQPYTQVQSYLDDTEPKGMHYYWKTEYLAELDDDRSSRR